MPKPGRVMTSTPTEAGADRQPAPPAGPFAEQRPGERGDHHRREEEDRGRLGELQRLQRQEIEEVEPNRNMPRSICAGKLTTRNIAGFRHARNSTSTRSVAGEARPRKRTAPRCLTARDISRWCRGRRTARRRRARAGSPTAVSDVRWRFGESSRGRSLGRTGRVLVQSGRIGNPQNVRRRANPAKSDYSSASSSSSIAAARRRRDWPRCAQAAWPAPSAPSCRGP